MKTIPALLLLLAAVTRAGASETVAWVPGHWQQSGSEQVWISGYYASSPVATPVACAEPQPQWVEGRWVYGSCGWEYSAGHWVQPAPVCEPAPAPVVYQEAPAPVYADNCRPHVGVSVVFGASYPVRPVCPLPVPVPFPGHVHGGYGYGHDHGGYGHAHGGYGYGLPLPLPVPIPVPVPLLPTPHDLEHLFHHH